MKNRLVLTSALFACAAAFVGCSSSKTADKTADASKAPQHASMGIINSKCPINPSHAAGDKNTVDYKGQKVGLCCGGCKAKWDALTDAQKDAAVAAAK